MISSHSSLSSHMSHIPYDVIREIASYVPDIDVRRAFGVFNKLNMKEHEHLNFVMRGPVITTRSVWEFQFKHPVHYQRYHLKNRVDVRATYIRDDTIDVVIYVNEIVVKYYFSMFRLSPAKVERHTNYIHSLL